MDGNKIAYRTEFPRINRVLSIGSTTGEDVIVSVTEGSTGQIVSSKCFEDHNEAMTYYSGRLITLKNAEEYETMLCAFEMLGLLD